MPRATLLYRRSRRGLRVTCLAALTTVLAVTAMPSQSPATVSNTLGQEPQNERKQNTGTPTEALNDGLSGLFGSGMRSTVQQPSWDSRRSPRHALLTFFEAMDHAIEGKEKGWVRAISVLPEGADDNELRERAMQLKEVLDRLDTPNPFDLPGTRAVEDNDLRRYRYFPSAAFDWVWERLEAPPRGRIELQRDESGMWSFTPSTVDGIRELWESTAALPPRHLPKLDDSVLAALFEPSLTGTSALGWVLFGVSIGIGVFLGLLTRRGLRQLRNWSSKKGWPVWAAALRLGGPIALASACGGLAVGIEFIHLTPTLDGILTGTINVVFGIAAGWALLRLVEVLGAWLSKATAGHPGALDRTLVPLLIKTVRVVLVTLLIVILLESALGINITGFIAGIGLIGLALSLAAKDSLQNLFGALTIYLEQPFQVGDVIRFGGSFGTVEEIGLRATTVRLLSGDIVYHPNMAFITDKVENVSVRSHIRRELDLTLPYDTPADKVEQAVSILEELLGEGELAESGRFDLDQYSPHVSFSAFNDASLNVKAYYWYQIEGSRDTGWFDYLRHCQDVNLAILRRFAKAGIDFAFPTQTLHLIEEQDSHPATLEGSGGGDQEAEPNAPSPSKSGSKAPVKPARDARRVDPADVAASDDGGAEDGDA